MRLRRRRAVGRGQWCEVGGDRSELRPLAGTEDGAATCLEMLRFLGIDFRQESFLVVWLDARCRPTGGRIVSVGTLTAALVHPREIFASALEQRAASIVLAHNHPSGDPQPSEEDFALSDRMEQVGQVLGIPVLDSIVVVSDGGYWSCSLDARVDASLNAGVDARGAEGARAPRLGRAINFAEACGKRAHPGLSGVAVAKLRTATFVDRVATPDDGDRCARCGHPFSAHRFEPSGFAGVDDHGCPE